MGGYEKPELKSIRNARYNNSYMGRLTRSYCDMRARTREKGFDSIVTREEFLKFAVNNVEYNRLYKQWEDSGYILKYCPTVDRIDNNKGYTLDNIQFLSLSANSTKGNNERSGKRHNGVVEYKERLKIIKDKIEVIFTSFKECALYLNVQSRSIYRALSCGYKVRGYTIQDLR